MIEILKGIALFVCGVCCGFVFCALFVEYRRDDE